MEFSGSAGNQPLPERGVLGALLSFVGSIARHLVALGGLARAESEEALANLLRLVVYAILCFLFAILGYLIGLLFLAFLLDELLGWRWLWTMFALAAAHFALVGVCAWNVRASIHTPMFTATMQEIRQDIDLLTRRHHASEPPPSADGFGEAPPGKPSV